MKNRIQTDDLPLKIINVSLIRVNEWNTLTNIGMVPVLVCLKNGQIATFVF